MGQGRRVCSSLCILSGCVRIVVDIEAKNGNLSDGDYTVKWIFFPSGIGRESQMGV